MVMVSRQRNVNRRGAVAVEAALVFPVLLLVTFAAIRYGWFFIKLQQITNVARCGARTAALYDTTQSDVTGIIRDLLIQYKIVDTGISDADLPVTYTITDPNGNVSTDVAVAYPQDKITVEISVPASDVDILPMDLFRFEPKDWELCASITMSKEGVPP
jgi:Flp pilus assembly protein TadG